MPIKVGTTSIKIPFDKAYVGSTLVYTSIVPSPYDYGDGSLNKTVMGYNGLVYMNGSLPTNQTSNYNYGNYQVNPDGPHNQIVNNASYFTGESPKIYVLRNTNEYNISFDATLEDKTCYIKITGGGATGSAVLGSLQFNCNGTYMSLAEMVTAGIIKPIVLIGSGSGNQNYAWHDVLKLYDNSGTTDTRNYPEATLIFMINKGNNITQIKLYSSVNFGTRYDGMVFAMCSIEDCRLTLNSY